MALLAGVEPLARLLLASLQSSVPTSSLVVQFGEGAGAWSLGVGQGPPSN